MTKFYAPFQGAARYKFFAYIPFLVGMVILGTTSVLANHPVLVEGNCNFEAFGHQNGPVAPGGGCGDYDGDGRIGLQEDNDGVDRIFGTLNGALGAAGIANNGTITIVTSGTFAEQIIITGNVTLQAAPGVEANIDAVLQGDAGSTARQGQFGVVVNAPANRHVVIRNITVRNWLRGFHLDGDSRVTIENCRVEHNADFGIDVNENVRVTITKSEVHATGFRLNPATGNFPTANTPNPGFGISFRGTSSGIVTFTTVTGNFCGGIVSTTTGSVMFIPNTNTIFDNGNCTAPAAD